MCATLADLRELPTLNTSRARLRVLTSGDTDDLFTVFSDPLSMRYWSSPPHRERSETAAMIESIEAGFAARRVLQWGIELTENARVVGTVTLLTEPIQPRAELGFILGSAYWGEGYASEAQRAVIGFAFGELGLHRLEADTHPSNEASLRSLERLGFQREGLLRERWLVGGERSDSVLLGLLAADWNPG